MCCTHIRGIVCSYRATAIKISLLLLPPILLSLKRNLDKGKVSYVFLTQMDAGGKLHTPTVLPSGKEPAVHTEKKPG